MPTCPFATPIKWSRDVQKIMRNTKLYTITSNFSPQNLYIILDKKLTCGTGRSSLFNTDFSLGHDYYPTPGGKKNTKPPKLKYIPSTTMNDTILLFDCLSILISWHLTGNLDNFFVLKSRNIDEFDALDHCKLDILKAQALLTLKVLGLDGACWSQDWLQSYKSHCIFTSALP